MGVGPRVGGGLCREGRFAIIIKTWTYNHYYRNENGIKESRHLNEDVLIVFSLSLLARCVRTQQLQLCLKLFHLPLLNEELLLHIRWR